MAEGTSVYKVEFYVYNYQTYKLYNILWGGQRTKTVNIVLEMVKMKAQANKIYS